MAIGMIEKKNGKFLTINGNQLKCSQADKFNVGDKIEYSMKKGNIKNPQLYKEVKIEESVEKKESVIQNNKIKTDLSKEERKTNNKTKVNRVIKKVDIDNSIDIQNIMKIDKVMLQEEKVDKVVKSISYEGLKNSQLSAFEGQLNKYNYNLKSEGLLKFVDERIKRNRAVEFYTSFKNELIENLQLVEAEFGISDLEQKYKNAFMRKLFEYMKKYYRYQGIVAQKKGDE